MPCALRKQRSIQKNTWNQNMCLQSMLNRSKAIKLAPKFMRSERVSRCECCQAVLGGPNPSSSSKLCACLSACQRLRIFLPRLARRHHQKQHVHRHLQSHRHCQTQPPPQYASAPAACHPLRAARCRCACSLAPPLPSPPLFNVTFSCFPMVARLPF